MGRASRKEAASAEPREHWSETHPDRHLWTEAQRVHARMQTQAEYEALYGRSPAANPRFSLIEDKEGCILLRKRGQHSSAEEARKSGDSLPLVRVSKEGLFLSSLAIGQRDEDMHAFALNRNQLSMLLDVSKEHFPDQGSLVLDDLWKSGANVFGDQTLAAGAFQYPSVETLLDTSIGTMENGDSLSLDSESYLLVHKRNSQFFLSWPGNEIVFDNPEDVTERALEEGQPAQFVFAPRPLRLPDPFATPPNEDEYPLVLLGESGGARLWANRDNSFILDTEDGQEILGWNQGGELVFALRTPADLSGPAADLLLRFLGALERKDG